MTKSSALDGHRKWFSSGELAGRPGFPTTPRGVLWRSKREGWESRPRQSRGGGREFYIPDGLPPESPDGSRRAPGDEVLFMLATYKGAHAALNGESYWDCPYELPEYVKRDRRLGTTPVRWEVWLDLILKERSPKKAGWLFGWQLVTTQRCMWEHGDIDSRSFITGAMFMAAATRSPRNV